MHINRPLVAEGVIPARAAVFYDDGTYTVVAYPRNKEGLRSARLIGALASDLYFRKGESHKQAAVIVAGMVEIALFDSDMASITDADLKNREETNLDIVDRTATTITVKLDLTRLVRQAASGAPVVQKVGNTSSSFGSTFVAGGASAAGGGSSGKARSSSSKKKKVLK